MWKGVKIGGDNIGNLRFIDDTVLIESESNFQKLMNKITAESSKRGIVLNSNKT